MSAKKSNPKIAWRPRGVRWSDDLYLTSTSEIDGRRRWLEIVLLLASKLQATDEDKHAVDLKAILLDDLGSEHK